MLNYPNLILIVVSMLVFNQCKAQSDNTGDQSKSTIKVRADIAQKLTESKLELEGVYEETVEFLNSVGSSDAEEYKNYLIQSHKGWKKYCEGKCKIIEYQSREAAQGGFAFYNLCMTELNNKRAEELKRILAELKSEFNN